MDRRWWHVGWGWMVAGTLALGAPLPQSREEIEEALKAFNRAKYLHQEERYEEAIQEYQRAARLDKENPFIFNYMGLALLSAQQYPRARDAFQKALELNPNFTDVHNNLGVLYSEMGEREKAFKEFSLVVRDPSFPSPEKPLYNLGELYLREDNKELALMHFRRAVEKNPNFAMGYRGLGKVYTALGDEQLAIESFEKSIERNPKDLESLYELGRLYDGMGDTERAQEYYRRVVEVDRFSPLGQLSLQRLDALKGPSSDQSRKSSKQKAG